MKLIRFGAPGAERPGVWLDPATPSEKPMLLDVRAMAFDIEDYNEHFFAHYVLERLANLLHEPGRKLVPAEGVRLPSKTPKPRSVHLGLLDRNVKFTTRGNVIQFAISSLEEYEMVVIT